MLKDYMYHGSYIGNDLNIGILLENPAEYGLSTDTLVFSVVTEAKRGGVKPELGKDITFFLIDESNRVHNTWVVSDAQSNNGEADCHRDGIICTEFKPEYLFQNLRLAFRYGANSGMKIIQLEH